MADKLSKLNWSTLVALVLLAKMVGITLAGNMAVYWGQNGDERTLAEVCNSGHYNFVVLPSLNTTANGNSKVLTLSDHCDGFPGGCTDLGDNVQACQSMDVKVLLSHSGGNSSAGDAEAQTVAKYLWDNFLGGSSPSHPLGAAVQMDGINFDTGRGNVMHYEAVANSLSQFGAQGGGRNRKLYLTSAPQSPYPAAVKIANLQDSKRSSLYIYRQTTDNANKHADPAQFATTLEKGY